MLSSKTSKQKALLALAWVCFFWGTTWLASKEGVMCNTAVIRRYHLPSLFYYKKTPLAKRQTMGSDINIKFFKFHVKQWA
jgi:hypothetical protein